MEQTRMISMDWALLLALSILWGGSFLAGRIAVQEVPAITLVLCRVAIAALVLYAALRILKVAMPTDRAAWKDFAGMGLLNNIIPFTLIFQGQVEIGAGLAAVINGMTPLWGALILRIAGAEALGLHKLIGILIGIVGLGAVIGPSALEGIDASFWAQMMVVGGTISYGFAALWGRRLRKYPPMVAATGQLSASSLMILPLALLVDQPWQLPVPSIEVIVSILGLAVLATALAYVLFFRILTSAGGTNVMLVTLLIPPSAILLGVLILGEKMTSNQLLGMVVILSGLVVIDGRVFSFLKR